MDKFCVILVVLAFGFVWGMKETGPVDKNINFLQLHRDNHDMVAKRKDKHVVILYHSTESWCSKFFKNESTLVTQRSVSLNSDYFGPILDYIQQTIGPILVNFVPTLEPIFHLGIFFRQNSKFQVKYFLTCSAM